MKKTVPYMLAILLTIATFSMHFGKRVDSMINDKNNVISENYLRYLIDVHKTDPTFSRRPVTTYLIEAAAHDFGITTGLSFILVNFSLLGIGGILLYHLSRQIGAGFRTAIVNMTVYFLCFSNLFAFFPPIYSYDEPLQYCLIFISMMFFFREQWILFVLLFSCAAIVRESSLILLPGFMLILFSKDGSLPRALFSRKNIISGMILLVPVIVYFIFSSVYIRHLGIAEAAKNDLTDRFMHFGLNFADPVASAESMFSWFIVLAVPLYFTYVLAKRPVLSGQQRIFINAFLVTVLINSVIVLLTTKARESRLFALPWIFMWPVFGILFRTQIEKICSLSNYLAMFRRWKYFFFFLFFNFLNYMISFEVYKTTAGGDDYFREYLFVVLFIIISHLFISDFKQKTQKKKEHLK